MNQGILFAGTINVDYIKYIEAYPQRNALTTILYTDRSTGGLVCNCALTLAKLDPELPIQAMGIVGQDAAGDYVLEQLSGYPALDTAGILRLGETSYTDVMTEEASGQRTFFHFRGSNALLAPEHFDFSKIRADILHVGYVLLANGLDAQDAEYPTALCRVLDAAQKAGIATSIDVVSEEGERFEKLVPPALRYTDYCIVNEIEAGRTTGVALRGAKGEVLRENLPIAAQKLMELGVGRWVVIHMPECYCGLERGGAYVEKDSWRLPEGFIKSAVGAGDAFAATVLYGVYRGWTLEKALHTAGAVAACSLSGAGATDAIRPLDALLRFMQESCAR